MKDIEHNHFKEYSESPEIVVEVPQLTTILGAFSDYIGGYALMSTNDHGLRLSISRRSDNTIRILNVNRQDKKKFQITNIKYRKEDRWANAAKAILAELLSDRRDILTGMNITVKGESAGGDNSSFAAAIFSGVIYALNELYSLHLSEDEMVRMAFNANRFCPYYNARLRDLITIFSAEEGKVIFFDLDSYETKSLTYPFNGYDHKKTVLLSSAIPYSVLTPEEDEFRVDCAELCQILKSKLPRNVHLRDLSDKDLRPLLVGLSETQRRYASYLIQESDIAKRGWEALSLGDVEGFSKLLYIQQKNLSSKAELSSPEIDWIVRRGNEVCGSSGLSQIYVGISGTLIALIDEECNLSYTYRLEEYERIFGFHAEVRDYTPSGRIRKIY